MISRIFEKISNKLTIEQTYLQKIQSIMLEGKSADRYLNFEKYVNALTAEQIKITANLLFNNQNVVTGILRQEKK